MYIILWYYLRGKPPLQFISGGSRSRTSKDEIVKDEIKIKYNENNPQDYYGEGSTLDKLGVIWYIVKIIALIISIFLLFNENILNKINLSIKKVNAII